MTEYDAAIDLGTTNTVCAVWERGGTSPRVVPITQPQDGFAPNDIRADSARPELPSAVGVFGRNARNCFVGRAVKKFAKFGFVAPHGALTSFLSIKRWMGTEGPENELGWSPEHVAACILRTVRHELLTRYGTAPRSVVITVPASFSTEARGATMAAATIAGFDPSTIRLLDEPTAALLSELGESGLLTEALQARADSARPLRAMVIDIGGGTLDVAIVDVATGEDGCVFDVLGRSRKTDLAGDDFDLDIAAMLLDRFVAERGVSMEALGEQEAVNLCADLMSQAETVKIALSNRLQGVRGSSARETVHETATVTCTPDGQLWQTKVSGNDLFGALARFFRPPGDGGAAGTDDFTFYRAIDDAAKSLIRSEGRAVPQSIVGVHESLDCILLTGGSARLPFMLEAVGKRFSHPNLTKVLMRELDYGVALGAARFAAEIDQVPLDHGRRVGLVERMYDGLYIETHTRQLPELVHPSKRVPIRPGDLPPVTLSIPKKTSVLELTTYLGADQDDPLMSPLLHSTVELGCVLQEHDSVELSIEVDTNREVRFTFVPIVDGERRQPVRASGLRRWWDRAARGFELPLINRVAGGVR